jgi:hypothetical protein
VVVALGLGLLVGACSDDNNDNTNNPDGGGTGGTPASHLSGTASGTGACDNPSEAPNNCYQYVGSTYDKGSCSGTFSTTAGCGSSGRAGRCTLFAGDAANEYVVHCYQSLSTCQQQCQGIGTFVAN